MTKLYTVTMEYEYVIAVEDDEDADIVAEETFRDAKYDISDDVKLFTSEMRILPAGWNDKCYPYRVNSEEKTIRQILEGT